MNRTERLLDLITYLLNARDPVSWQEIKNHFPEDYARGIEESNQRKFERDKAELISLGIPIDYLSGADIKKEGYIVCKEKFFLPEIHFTARESSLLMLSAGAVQDSENFPYSDQLESALHKIISVQNKVNPPPQEFAITYQSRNAKEGSPGLLQSLQDALDRRKTVKIRYHAFSTGQTTERTVNPYGLLFRKGRWTLVGWDHLRRDLRNFVLTRIEASEVNSKRPGTPDYEIPEDFSLKAYRNQQPWRLDLHPLIEVTVRISEHRLPELVPQLSEETQLDERTFKLEVTNQGGAISWILSQKTDVKVLGPEAVRDEIQSLLSSLQ